MCGMESIEQVFGIAQKTVAISTLVSRFIRAFLFLVPNILCLPDLCLEFRHTGYHSIHCTLQFLVHIHFPVAVVSGGGGGELIKTARPIPSAPLFALRCQ